MCLKMVRGECSQRISSAFFRLIVDQHGKGRLFFRIQDRNYTGNLRWVQVPSDFIGENFVSQPGTLRTGYFPEKS